MPSIVQAINDFKFEPTKEDILAFLISREDIRIKKESDAPLPWTKDPILRDSKFLNVFREHDKVSREVFKYAPSDDLIYPYVYIARLVNHVVHIPQLFKDTEWLKNGVKAKMQEFVDKGTTVCNPGAYQINPRIGFKYGYRNIRDALIHVVPDRLEYVIEALKSTNKLDVAADRANEAFGGFTNFWMFQAALDIAWLRPDLMDRDSEPYLGSGSKQVDISLHDLQEYLNDNKPKEWRQFYLFDVENALCEFRKYKMRQEQGIPNNRQYKNELKLF